VLCASIRDPHKNSPSVIRPESFARTCRPILTFTVGERATAVRRSPLLFRVANSMRYEYLRDCRGGLLLRCRVRHFRGVWLSRINLNGPLFSCNCHILLSQRGCHHSLLPRSATHHADSPVASHCPIDAVAWKACDALPGRSEKRGRSPGWQSTAFLCALSWLSRCVHQSRRNAGAFARSGVLVGVFSEDAAGRDESAGRSIDRASATTRRLDSSACNSTRWSRSNREYQNSFPGISFPLS
jgi:hypothetical protein